MTTLITVSDPDGVIGTCDARCYNAKGGECHCVCYGLNHAKGENFAITFTDHLADIIAAQIKIRFPTVTLITFHQEQLYYPFHAPIDKLQTDAHQTQNDGADGDEPHG